MLSFVHHFKAIREFKLELQSGNAQFGSKLPNFCSVWPWNLKDDLKNNRAPFLCYSKLCTSFQSHGWIQTEATVRKRSVRVKIGILSPASCYQIWRTTLKNYRVLLLCYFKLCASFRSHRWIKTGVIGRKRLNWVLTSVTLTFDFYVIGTIPVEMHFEQTCVYQCYQNQDMTPIHWNGHAIKMC